MESWAGLAAEPSTSVMGLQKLSNADMAFTVVNFVSRDMGLPVTVADVTHGYGRFTALLYRPCFVVYSSDFRKGQHPDIVADYVHLPYRDCCVDIILFDPPYSNNVSCGRKKSYSNWRLVHDEVATNRWCVWSGNIDGVTCREFARVLKAGGSLIFKDTRIYYYLPHFSFVNLFIQDLGCLPKIPRCVVKNYAFWSVLRKA